MKRLYFSDDLQMLDDHADLICLATPFNSRRDFNLPFKSLKRHKSKANAAQKDLI